MPQGEPRRSSLSYRSVTGMHVKINKEHAKMHVKIKKACENKNKEHAKNVKQNFTSPRSQFCQTTILQLNLQRIQRLYKTIQRSRQIS